MNEGVMEKTSPYSVLISGKSILPATKLSSLLPNYFFSPADLNYLLIYIKQFLS